MRIISAIALAAFSVTSISACAPFTSETGTTVASASCDKFEGYPDCPPMGGLVITPSTTPSTVEADVWTHGS